MCRLCDNKISIGYLTDLGRFAKERRFWITSEELEILESSRAKDSQEELKTDNEERLDEE